MELLGMVSKIKLICRRREKTYMKGFLFISSEQCEEAPKPPWQQLPCLLFFAKESSILVWKAIWVYSCIFVFTSYLPFWFVPCFFKIFSTLLPSLSDVKTWENVFLSLMKVYACILGSAAFSLWKASHKPLNIKLKHFDCNYAHKVNDCKV